MVGSQRKVHCSSDDGNVHVAIVRLNLLYIYNCACASAWMPPIEISEYLSDLNCGRSMMVHTCRGNITYRVIAAAERYVYVRPWI